MKGSEVSRLSTNGGGGGSGGVYVVGLRCRGGNVAEGVGRENEVGTTDGR